MSEIPPSTSFRWETKQLSEVCEIERGGSPRPIDSFLTDDPSGINWIKIGDTKGVTKFIYQTQEKIRPEGARRSRLVVEGDFILSNSMSFGRPYIMKTTGCIHDGWLLLRPKEPRINQDFLYYVLGSDLIFRQFDSLAAGSTVRNLNIGLVKSVRIPVPPKQEQERIVTILDEAFEKIAIVRANVEKCVESSRELFTRHLDTIFREIAASQQRVTIDQVCDSIMDCVNKTAPVIEGPTEFKMIRTTNIRNGSVSLDSVRYVTEETYKTWTRRETPTRGDVLLTREAPMGEAGMLTTEDKVFLGQRIVSYRPTPTKLLSKFLLFAFQSSHLQAQIASLASGSTVQHMRVPDSKALLLPLPPLTEQRRVVERIEKELLAARQLEANYCKKLIALERLRQSLLNQTLSGQLMKQTSKAVLIPFPVNLPNISKRRRDALHHLL